ncbi:MgtC/SapB family protein [Aestuariicella hydrocarbonica]|uniref:Protein MgtC n=1 Tax=Pseudomaricurvus hydrocarbonicus TaxID=1470433 RepID=A0A9E5JUK4_9GAMM|nr:MgtC/SapB family protein [Aestuariicella hydrocarbonica]NHO64841.1 MgtC/SapB family protein [Aestuariicella hydrocarbonica]
MSLGFILDISPFNWSSIGCAIFSGSIIGLERQLRGKPVGIRTASLIVLGTYTFLATAFLLKGDIVDPSRVVGQVITGIGFLGAGVMLAKDGAVIGVTSAATIWVLAAIGVMIACDYPLQAIKLSIVVVAILYGVDVLEENTKTFSRGVHTKIKHYRRQPRSGRAQK